MYEDNNTYFAILKHEDQDEGKGRLLETGICFRNFDKILPTTTVKFIQK